MVGRYEASNAFPSGHRNRKSSEKARRVAHLHADGDRQEIVPAGGHATQKDNAEIPQLRIRRKGSRDRMRSRQSDWVGGSEGWGM